MKTIQYTNGTIFCNGYILDNEGNKIYSPTQNLLTTLGWSKVEDRDTKINQLIRARYTLDLELQVQRKRDIEPEKFAAYNEYVEECIQKVKDEMGESE